MSESPRRHGIVPDLTPALSPPDPHLPQEIEVQLRAQDLIRGEALAEIKRVGWDKYKQYLKDKLSYANFAEWQLLLEKHEENQPKKPESPRLNPREIATLQSEVDELETVYRPNQLSGQQGINAYKQSDTKFHVCGKRAAEYFKSVPAGSDEFLLTRVYCAPPIKNAVKVYHSLIRELHGAGVLTSVDAVLNLAMVSPNKPDSPTNNNETFNSEEIILYGPGRDSKVMEAVARAIEQSQQNQAELWKHDPADSSRVTKRLVENLLIPIAPSVGFVELTDGHSYHTLALTHMTEDLFNKYLPGEVSFQERVEQSKKWTPDRPAVFGHYSQGGNYVESFPGSGRRRRHMPGLVFPNGEDGPAARQGASR